MVVVVRGDQLRCWLVGWRYLGETCRSSCVAPKHVEAKEFGAVVALLSGSSTVSSASLLCAGRLFFGIVGVSELIFVDRSCFFI